MIYQVDEIIEYTSGDRHWIARVVAIDSLTGVHVELLECRPKRSLHYHKWSNALMRLHPDATNVVSHGIKNEVC